MWEIRAPERFVRDDPVPVCFGDVEQGTWLRVRARPAQIERGVLPRK